MTTASPNHVARGGCWLGFENGIQVTDNTIDGVTQASSPTCSDRPGDDHVHQHLDTSPGTK